LPYSDVRVVVALGGNAILRAGQSGTFEEQMENVRRTCLLLADVIEEGWQLVLAHGNGPQVGNILIQNEEAARLVPAMPLDACGAQSQGLIGYMIQQSLENALASRNLNIPVVTVLTQVVVDARDPAFENPTKPIGPFYERERAYELIRGKGYHMRDCGRGWRRLVPSPDPKAILERAAIRSLVESGAVVVACGGGGVPVTAGGGRISGLEAVIDKDLAAERLAADLGAGRLVMLTDVERVALNYGRPDQRELDRMTLGEAERYLAEGHFGEGSMGPKVEAAIRFVRLREGNVAVIAALERAADAVRGKAGTVIER